MRFGVKTVGTIGRRWSHNLDQSDSRNPHVHLDLQPATYLVTSNCVNDVNYTPVGYGKGPTFISVWPLQQIIIHLPLKCENTPLLTPLVWNHISIYILLSANLRFLPCVSLWYLIKSSSVSHIKFNGQFYILSVCCMLAIYPLFSLFQDPVLSGVYTGVVGACPQLRRPMEYSTVHAALATHQRRRRQAPQ